ncbi:MAG: ATP phosphoribosyltransferase [Betaproteobacteria bacterium]|nr:ATP phosphoribosyltransferase [Betaproteobacteria bacterium]
MLTVALPKGRILAQAQSLLASSGLQPADPIAADDRRIVIACKDAGLRLIIVRAADVQTYVACGAAQIGLAGRDLLLDNPLAGIYQGPATALGKCRLAVAARADYDYAGRIQRGARVVVATKYPRLARNHFARVGVHAEIVRLYGSMELAPLVGLADLIVDLVETGQTLKANRLVEVEQIMPICTQVIFNQGAFLRRRTELDAIAAQLAAGADE